MRQSFIVGHGGTQMLQLRESTDPLPQGGEVRIRVKAAGVNFAEVMARLGLYLDAPKTQCVVGYEVAGVVDAVGPGTTPGSLGRELFALTRFARAVAGGRRRVDDVGPGIQFGLRHHVAGRVVPGLVHIQQVVLVGVAAVEAVHQHRRLVRRERVVDHHVGDRRIARVGHRQRVADGLAGHIGRAAGYRRVLLDVQGPDLNHRHARIVVVGRRSGAGDRRRVVDVGPGIQFGLRSFSAIGTFPFAGIPPTDGPTSAGGVR